MTAAPSGLPAQAVTVTPETLPFWEAATRHVLLLSHCPACEAVIWYPRAVCPFCHRPGTDWVEASGHGTVYSFAVTRQGQGAYRESSPYVLAYVELAEGPRIMTNIFDVDVDHLRVGQQVSVSFDPTADGYALPRFRPSPPGDA